MLLQLCFGMPIGFVEGLSGILEVVKLTELMGHLREDKKKTPTCSKAVAAITRQGLEGHCRTLAATAERLPAGASGG